MVDEWSGFAALLANLIEKYAVVLNLDALPDLVIEEAVPEKDGADEMIYENDIESAKAAPGQSSPAAFMPSSALAS